MFWFGVRRAVLQAQPLCIGCLAAGRITLAREVHHVIALRAGGANDPANCVGLCKSCHSRHTAREGRWGLGRSRRPHASWSG
jgi:5-methylcytosine-specific restriction protein A